MPYHCAFQKSLLMKTVFMVFLVFCSIFCSAQTAISSNDSLFLNTISLKEEPAWIVLDTSRPKYEKPIAQIEKERSFKRKAWRAARVIFGGEVATMSFLAAMPSDFSNWNKNFYDHAATNWKRAFTMPPKFDDDPFLVNYIQHPLAGAIYYNGVRSQGASQLQSFFFAVGESTFFEYFIESVAERPSIQDLIVTPVAGYFIGELQHQTTLLLKRNGFNFAEKVFVLLINPMYVVFNGYKTTHIAARF